MNNNFPKTVGSVIAFMFQYVSHDELMNSSKRLYHDNR